MQVHKRSNSGDRAVNGAILQCRQYVTQRHRNRRRSEPIQRHGLELRSEDPNLFSFEIGQVRWENFEMMRGRLRKRSRPTPCRPFAGAESEHQFSHGWIGSDPLPVLEQIDETRSRHHLEAFINANDKLGRYRPRPSMAPNCTPSIFSGGVEPNWLAG